MADSKTDLETTANSVSLRLPEFSTTNPRVWFVQLEIYFRNRRITTSLAKYEQLSMLLPDRVASEVLDILENPPAVDPYMTLKDAILSRTTASEEACLQRLLSGVELGDRTPSQLLRHMRSLAGTFTVDDAVLRSLWMKCLPNNTKLVLSTYDAESPLEKLAKTADKIHESFFAQTVTAVHTPDCDKPHPVDDSDDLRQQIAALNLKVDRLCNRSFRPRARTPTRSRSRPRPSKPLTANNTGVCYYHRRFGNDARKCTLPCTHPKAFVNYPPPGNCMASQ